MMEEKESTISGSPDNTESGSPTPISFVGGGAIPNQTSTVAGVIGGGGGGGGIGDGMIDSRKKRGRPRKYDAEGNLSPAYAASAARRAAVAATVAATAATVTVMSQPPGFSLTTSNVISPKSTTTSYEISGPKKGRELFAETAGADFTPHVITVQSGEGRFEILSLSGSFTVSEANGITSKTGGLSITLAGPDGRVVGGGVAGWIIAANPIQVVVGTFVPVGNKTQKRKYHRESHATSMAPAHPDTTPAEFANTQPMPHYHEAGPPSVSPVPAHSQSEADDSIGSGHNLNVVSSHDTLEWNNGSEPHRLYPDINVSVPGV
ncbi:hypothetical protein KSS87_012508 [Heliosperma pusillum]|nr:hypothetical protein KSS87_012508 [Heliosperma pusillum]